jgi:CDP-glycerol glycerophosphotransferase (TagB/SpsB family)
MSKLEEKLRTDNLNPPSKIKIHCSNLRQDEDKVSFNINKEMLLSINKWNLCVKKRKESALFYFTYSCVQKDDSYYFELSLEQFLDVFKEKARFDLFVSDEDGNTSRLFFSKLEINQLEERYLDIADINEEFSISCYRAKNAGVSFILSSKQNILNESFDGKAILKHIQFNSNGKCKLSITMGSKKVMKIESLVLRRRKSINDEKIEIFPESIKNYKSNIQMIFVFEAKEIQWEQFYWDAFLKVRDHDDNEIYLRIKNNRLRNKIKLQYTLTRYTCDLEDNYMVYPYITASEALSFNYRLKGPYEAAVYKRNEKIALVLYLLFGWIFRLQNIWMVHEKFSETAQDNGFYFFKYVYEHQYSRKVYFVIRKGSSDIRFVKHMKNRVVYFMSIKHLFLLLTCSKIISSESKGHGYVWRVSKGWIRPAINQKPFVFLQHGVLGLKMIDNTFKANGMNHANLFVASSDFEKDIVMRYLGYSPNEVIVTGLARWDNLHQRKKETQKEKSILFMPTWRNWLEEAPDDDFLQSEYFQEYSAIIKSKKINQWLNEHHSTLYFYIHPKFAQFISYFKTDSDRIKIIFFGEQPLNKLLMDADLLITDYSSIAFEAFYQEKPTIFYQFDREKYIELQGSYMDLERDLFGPSARNENELLEKLDRMHKDGFKMEDKYLNFKEHYFRYYDNHNSERIYNSIVQWENSRTWNQNIIYYLKRNPIVRTLWRKVKVKLIPLRKNN